MKSRKSKGSSSYMVEAFTIALIAMVLNIETSPSRFTGRATKVSAWALMMKQWSSDVVLCTDGASEISPTMQSRLKQHDIAIWAERIAKLEGTEDGALRRIHLHDGKVLERTAIFFTTGCHQASDLSAALGCARDEKGGIVTDPVTEESSVRGVYVAGDASRDVLLVAVAIAEGAKAGVAINRALLQEDGGEGNTEAGCEAVKATRGTRELGSLSLISERRSIPRLRLFLVRFNIHRLRNITS